MSTALSPRPIQSFTTEKSVSALSHRGGIIPTPAGPKNQIMIKPILRAFLLMTFTVAAGLLSVSHAQQSTIALTGEWVGNSEPSGRSEFLRLSLTENAGEMKETKTAQTQTIVVKPVEQVRKNIQVLK